MPHYLVRVDATCDLLVTKGDHVAAGQAVGKSLNRPGSEAAHAAGIVRYVEHAEDRNSFLVYIEMDLLPLDDSSQAAEPLLAGPRHPFSQAA